MSAKDAGRYEAKEGKPTDHAGEFGRINVGDYTNGAELLDEIDFAGSEARPNVDASISEAAADCSPLRLADIRSGAATVSSFAKTAVEYGKSRKGKDGSKDLPAKKKNSIAVEGGIAYEEESLDFLDSETDGEKDKFDLKGKLAQNVLNSLAGKAKKFEKAVVREALDGLDDQSAEVEAARFVEHHSREGVKKTVEKTYSAAKKAYSATRKTASSAGRMAATRTAASSTAASSTAVSASAAAKASGAATKAKAAIAAVPKSPAGWMLAVGAGFLLIGILFSFVMCSGGAGLDDSGENANLEGLSSGEASVARWLLDEGFSIESTAAIMGNIANEGGFDPDRWEVNNDGVAYNPYERAFGMFQYTSTHPGTGLYHRFKTWCSENGKDPFEHESSLEFTFTHETGGYFGSSWYMSLASNGYYANCPGYDRVGGGPYTADEFKDANDVGRATYSWMSCYERCANGQYAHLDRRLDSAEAYYEILCQDAAGGGSIASVGDLIWPSATPQWLTYSGHFGLDIQSMYGTPIYAPADGVVMWAGWSWESTYGNIVRIDHDSLGLQTACAHMSRVSVEAGDRVEQGDVIGYVGSTGNSSGPHIHFEIYERDDGLRLGYPIMDDMNKWGLYFDREELENNRVG